MCTFAHYYNSCYRKREKRKHMRLAFLISTQKEARHLRDLVDSLPQDADYYIHIDHKRDLQHFKKLVDRSNVHFISHRINVIAASLSEVEVQIALIRAALESGTYDRLISIGGQDYPLWSNKRIEEFFANVGDKQILEAIAMPGQGRAAYKYTDFQLLADHSWRGGTWKSRVRSLARRVLAGGHVHKTLRIHCPNKTYTLYLGGPSWAITPELAQKIVDEWDTNAHLKKYFSTSYRPLETFIPTVALNSEFASQCTLLEGHYEGMSQLMPLTFFIGKTAKVLTEDDFSAVKNSDKMFCRQVVTGYSDGLKSLIDANRRDSVAVKDVVA